MSTKIDIIDDKVSPAFYFTSSNSEAIHDAVSRSFGISAWFKSYVSSQQFSSLASEYKEEAFELFENLKFMLQQLEKLELDEADMKEFNAVIKEMPTV